MRQSGSKGLKQEVNFRMINIIPREVKEPGSEKESKSSTGNWRKKTGIQKLQQIHATRGTRVRSRTSISGGK